MSQGSDPFEFIKNFWANVPGMGAAGGGPAMPSFDPKDLEKRVSELKQVKQWLEMNLNMLNLQINTLEMQLTAVNSFENYTHNATHNTHGARSSAANDSASPDMSQANEAAGAAAKAASEAGASAIAQGAQALQSMPWANPGDWIKSMQAAFGSGMPVVKTKAKAKGAATPKSRPSAARPAAGRAAKPKRTRKTP